MQDLVAMEGYVDNWQDRFDNTGRTDLAKGRTRKTSEQLERTD
jgi:hypothetical protein